MFKTLLRTVGLARKFNDRSPVHVDKDELSEHLNDGRSLRECARLLGVSHTTVWRHMNGYHCRCEDCWR